MANGTKEPNMDQLGLGLSFVTPPPPTAKDIRAHVLSTIEDVDPIQTRTPSLTPTSTRGSEERLPLAHSESAVGSMKSVDAERVDELKTATVCESDIEACLYSKDVKVAKTCQDSKVWPGRRTLLRRYKDEKRRQETCNPLKNLDKRMKIIIKVLIILLVIGGATGLGIGISKAVGGGIWKSSNSTKPIGR